ncbi:MAG: DUF4239 domain-containing protein [Chloroflexota bacterium]
MSESWVLLFPAIILFVAILATIGLLIVRRMPRFVGMFHENEVAGHQFAALGVLYGALLAFVVFAAWERWSEAQHAVSEEAAAIVTAYRDTQDFPDPLKGEAQVAYRGYIDAVVQREWANHGTVTAHTTPDALNPLYEIYRSWIPENTMNELRLQSAEDRLHDLELIRHERHLSSEVTLPWIFLVMLVLGGAIMIVFSYFFQHSSLKSHAVMTFVSTAMLVGVLLLIYSLNQPFTGPVTVSQQPLQHAKLQLDALDMEAPIPSPEPRPEATPAPTLAPGASLAPAS